VRDVNTFVLGGHGDTMVPVVQYSTVAGIPVPDLIVQGRSPRSGSTPSSSVPRSGGGEIVACSDRLGLSTPRRIGDRHGRELSRRPEARPALRARVQGKYGIDDLYVGVPVVIGAGGVEEVIEIALDDAAKAGLQVSIDAVKELLVACKGIDSRRLIALPSTASTPLPRSTGCPFSSTRTPRSSPRA
jgi:malate dehydrogenase